MLDRYQYARIAISTYPNTYYDQQLVGWRRLEYQSTTELHQHRERIAKKVRRHLAKFNALPPLERQALLSAHCSTTKRALNALQNYGSERFWPGRRTILSNCDPSTLVKVGYEYAD